MSVMDRLRDLALTPRDRIAMAADEHMATRLIEYANAAKKLTGRGPLPRSVRLQLLRALDAYEGPRG